MQVSKSVVFTPSLTAICAAILDLATILEYIKIRI